MINFKVKNKKYDQKFNLIVKLRKEMEVMEQEELKKMLPAVQAKYMNKCYKTKNSFGPDEYWWLYYKVVDVTTKGLKAHQFEKCANGEYRFKLQETYEFEPGEDWLEITVEVYETEKRKLLEELKRT